MSDTVQNAGYLRENYRYFHLRDTAGQERDFHFHEFDKLVLLISGAVDYTVEGSTYRLRPWDVLLVRHHAIHRAIIDKSVPYERVILYLDHGYFERLMPEAGLLRCFDEADASRSYLLSPTAEQRRELEAAVETYERSARDRRFGAEAMCETVILQLLIHVSRMATAAPDRPDAAGDMKIQKAIAYIDEHFREELSVEQLAERVYLSRYHFMRLFKQQTGSTVHSYIRQRRLLYAARLIREGVPAAKAALESGFGDYSAFHRAFRDSFGISPGSLRK